MNLMQARPPFPLLDLQNIRVMRGIVTRGGEWGRVTKERSPSTTSAFA